MATVRDQTFWKRFSTAVHQDEAAKEEVAQGPNLKHSYVITLSEHPASAPGPATATPAPTSQPPTTLSLQPRALAPVVLSPAPSAAVPPHSPAASAFWHPSPPASPSSPILLTSPEREPKRLKKAHVPRGNNSHHFGRHPHGNASQLTLGLSGRPQSRFKFWTSVTADPSNRQSWLEGQRRKRKHRAWVCWGFWICLLLVVGGVVAAVLVLKSKHII